MQLDHIFMFVEPTSPEFGHFARLGLTETYRRQHPGQGTENACICFDNVFIELLWINDAVAAKSPRIARTRLYERSLWQIDGTCPFGISWRDADNRDAKAPICWDYAPPYLPQGMTIAVAEASDDPFQPMIFRSPGTTPPAEWPRERRGSLQSAARLGSVDRVELQMPVEPCDALRLIAAQTGIRLLKAPDGAYRLSLHAAGITDGCSLRIDLPLAAR
jgi:hypothetical protein